MSREGLQDLLSVHSELAVMTVMGWEGSSSCCTDPLLIPEHIATSATTSEYAHTSAHAFSRNGTKQHAANMVARWGGDEERIYRGTRDGVASGRAIGVWTSVLWVTTLCVGRP